MKKLLRKVLLVTPLLFLLLANTAVFAEDPIRPPNPGGGPAGNGPTDPMGGPINDGIYITLALGIAYGCFKTYEIRKKKISAKEKETPV